MQNVAFAISIFFLLPACEMKKNSKVKKLTLRQNFHSFFFKKKHKLFHKLNMQINKNTSDLSIWT